MLLETSSLYICRALPQFGDTSSAGGAWAAPVQGSIQGLVVQARQTAQLGRRAVRQRGAQGPHEARCALAQAAQLRQRLLPCSGRESAVSRH